MPPEMYRRSNLARPAEYVLCQGIGSTEVLG